MTALLDRFLRYVQIDTQSNEASSTVPSTAKQLDLCKLLAAECREMGLADVSLDKFGIVMATVPATVVGHGAHHIDLKKLDAICAYTLDGDGEGCVDCETFSADQAIVTVTGINIHPSIGMGKMVNAVRILAEFLTKMPAESLSPESTSE